MQIEGGRKMAALAARKRRAQVRGPDALRVGFFKTAKYQDGTLVSHVAARNEFGFGVPERPFFRIAIRKLRSDRVIERLLKDWLQPPDHEVTDQIYGLIGLQVQDRIQQSIVDLRTPPNSPATIARKLAKSRGSTEQGEPNPLIDTGKMRLSVTWARGKARRD